MKTIIGTVLIVAMIVLAASRWIRGWRSQIRHEQTSAVVRDLARSSRTPHPSTIDRVFGPDDGNDAA